MKNFLTIVLRNQFNLFYRFGYTVIPKFELIEFDGIINKEIKGKVIKQFTKVTPFEYDDEYLILHFEKSINHNDNFIEFEIQELVNIYPLSQQAKTSIESKTDQRIRLESPIFETLLPAIETEIDNKEVEKAITALWTICKIEEPIEKYLSYIGIENIFKGLAHRKNGTWANKIQGGVYWEYLIAYNYYQYFPEGMIRYFYQLGEVFSYFKGKVDGIEGTKLAEILNQIESGNFEQILKKINYESLPKSFVTSMEEIGKSNFDPIIVSVLFLKWKTDLNNKDVEITNTSIFHNGNVAFIDKFPTEVKLAIIFVAAFFGFRRFYDQYYEVLNLRFYKDFKTPKKQTKKIAHQEKYDTVSTTDEAVKIANEEQKHIKTKYEDEVSETTINEVHDVDDKTAIQAEEKKSEIKVEELSNSSNNQQNDHKVGISDIVSQYQKIIEEALDKQAEVKLSDIVSLIKEKTGKKLQNNKVESIAKEMKGIKVIKIGQAKGITRTKGLLFNL